jgi:hypothetical protein
MADTPAEEQGLPPSLRFLKGLVTTLMITMILGVIAVVYLLVTRMPDGRAQIPALPPDIVLPKGAVAQAVTFGTSWSAVVTTSQTLLIYDAKGVLVQSLDLQDLASKN